MLEGRKKASSTEMQAGQAEDVDHTSNTDRVTTLGLTESLRV